MTKPFSPNELIARIRAVLRRFDNQNQSQNINVHAKKLVLGNIHIDTEQHRVHVNESEIKLTLAEFKLITKLVSKPGRVFSREQLLETIAGSQTYLIDRNIDVHIRSLRKKLDDQAHIIETVRGVGYRCKG